MPGCWLRADIVWTALLLLCLFGALGLALFVTGATMLQRRVRARMAGPARVGEVVRWEVIRPSAIDRRAPSDSGPPLRPRFVPHVRYTDAQGRSHTARVAIQHARQERMARREGTPYAVYPRVAHPDLAYGDRWHDLVLPVLLVCAGALVLLPVLGMVIGAVV